LLFVINILGNMSEDIFEKILDYIEAQVPLPVMTREVAIAAFCSTVLSELSRRARIRCGQEVSLPNSPQTNAFEQFKFKCFEIHDGSALLPALEQLSPSHESSSFFAVYRDLVQKEDFSLLPADKQDQLSALEKLGCLPKPKHGYKYSLFPAEFHTPNNMSPIELSPEGQNGFQQISEEHDAIDGLLEGSIFDESESNLRQELDLPNESPITEVAAVQAPVPDPMPCETTPTGEEPSGIGRMQTRSMRRVSKRTLSKSPPPASPTRRKARKVSKRPSIDIDEKDMKWSQYLSAVTNFKEENHSYHIPEDRPFEIEGETVYLGRWLQDEKQKLDFYFGENRKRYLVLSEWFTNELLDEHNNLIENSLVSIHSPISLCHSLIDCCNEEGKTYTGFPEEDTVLPAPTSAAVIAQTAPSHSPVLDLPIPRRVSPLTTPVLHRRTLPERMKKTRRNANSKYIGSVIAFKKETLTCCYVNLGRIVSFVDQMNVRIQRYHLSNSLPELVIEESSEQLEISYLSVVIQGTKFIEFELMDCNGSKFLYSEIFDFRCFYNFTLSSSRVKVVND
jgi:hypothetical protein